MTNHVDSPDRYWWTQLQFRLVAVLPHLILLLYCKLCFLAFNKSFWGVRLLLTDSCQVYHFSCLYDASADDPTGSQIVAVIDSLRELVLQKCPSGDRVKRTAPIFF